MRRLVDLKMSVEKKNKIDEIIKDLTDVIDMLKYKERWSNPKVLLAWQEKYKGVNDRINELSEKEYQELEVRYKKACDENPDTIRSTH